MTQDEFNAWIRARFNLWTKSDVDAEVRKEREACAQIADKHTKASFMGAVGAAIRARGEQA
jgi:hypothetical protein